ncbi:MAG: cobalamin biosynthesis protein CobD [Desulforhopalus sp.]|nr:cobalamin biosynthesis protein CobD [Desulforhopalus sp.]
MIYFSQLLSAILLDALLGDPRWYPHPVRGIGLVCSWSEAITRLVTSNLYLAGFITVIVVLGTTGTIVSLILYAAASFSSTAEGVVAVILLYTTIAARDLLRHSNEVYVQLQDKVSLENARIAVGKIVGRDTNKLNEDGICRASIETVAENMVDGITAPLFFAILASCFAPVLNISPITCSVIGAFLYKAVNTMDSMIAYKNERYLKFGRVAAKLDDAVNFFPARLSGVCLIIAAFILKLDYRKAAKVFLRDRLKHSSPNAGHTEAVTAGALGIRLGGPSFYFDTIVEKPFMGDSDSEPVPADIKKTNRLVIVGSLLFFFLLVGMRMLLI